MSALAAPSFLFYPSRALQELAFHPVEESFVRDLQAGRGLVALQELAVDSTSKYAREVQLSRLLRSCRCSLPRIPLRPLLSFLCDLCVNVFDLPYPLSSGILNHRVRT